MNFNYDLVTWIDYFIGAFACCFGSFIIGKILLNKKINSIKWYSYILLLIFSILTIFNTLIFDNVGKIFGVILILFGIYKIIFYQKTKICLLYSIATYLLLAIGEITLTLLISLILLFVDFNATATVIKSAVGNLFVIVFSCLYSYLLKNKINNVLRKIDKSDVIYILLLGVVSIFVLLSSLYKLSLNNWNIGYEFILNTVIFIGGLILMIILIKQNIHNKEIMDKYILLKDYLKTSAELIEKYSTTIHKYKNNLIAIKGYIRTDEKKANSYIDDLLETYDIKKYSWFNKINNVKIDVLRYLLYYKLSKAESHNLNIVVNVSEDLHKYKNDILSIKEINVFLDILGELFDNAIYASIESKEKELNIVLYEEDEIIKFILSNTYKEKVNISLINKNGYTTKGEGHGLGLYDIDKTIKKYNIFHIDYEIIDNYFVSTLTIYLEKK